MFGFNAVSTDLAVADQRYGNHEQRRANDPKSEEPTSPIHCGSCSSTNAETVLRLVYLRACASFDAGVVFIVISSYVAVEVYGKKSICLEIKHIIL